MHSRSRIKEVARELPIDLHAWERDCYEFEHNVLPGFGNALDSQATGGSTLSKFMARGMHNQGREVTPDEMADVVAGVASILTGKASKIRARIHCALVSKIASQQVSEDGPLLPDINLQDVLRDPETVELVVPLETAQQKLVWTLIVNSLCVIAVRQASNILNLQKEDFASTEEMRKFKKGIEEELKDEVIVAQGITLLKDA